MVDALLEADELAEWLDGLVGDDPDALIAMYRVCVDESGTHEDAPVMCVAGLVATSTQWRLLAKRWTPFVRALKLTNGYHAHTRRCKAEANPFLADLIAEHVEYGVSATFVEAEYRAHTTPKLRSVIGASYTLGVQCIVYEIGTWCHGWGTRKAAYVLESGHKNEAHTYEQFQRIMNDDALREQCRVLSHTWVAKGDVAGLDAADLAAHEIASCYGGDYSPVLAKFADKMRMVHFTPSYLADFEQTVQPVLKRKQRKRKR